MAPVKIAITARSFNTGGEAYKKLMQSCEIIYVNKTGARLSEKDLIAAIRDADATLSGTEIFSKTIIESAPHLKVISRIGVGTDNIDIDACNLQSVRVYNTPAAPAVAVAEHTLALLLSAMKRIPQYYYQVKNGDHSVTSGMQIAGKTAGIIGFGRIGKQVGILLSAMGCSVVFFDPYMNNPPVGPWKRMSSLEDLARCSDIITLHSNSPKTGKPLITHDILSIMKTGVIIINTARGTLIDENALDAAVGSGHVAAAGLDVTVKEPYSGPLLRHPGVIITPHVASNTAETRNCMEMEAVTNILTSLGV